MSFFAERLRAVLQLDPAVDVIEYENQWLTWGQLSDAIIDITRAVERAVGTQASIRDLRIGVLVRNHPSSFAAILAAMAGEACMVSLNPLFPDDRVADDLGSLKLPVVIGNEADLARPHIQAVLQHAGSAVISLSGVLGEARVQSEVARSTRAGICWTQPGVIIEMLTSGTTGIPKRIPLNRDAFDKSFVGAMSYEKGRNRDEVVRLKPDVDILSNPLTHIGGLWAAITSIASGRRSVLLEKFSVERWHDAIRRHRPKVARAVPAALRMILDAKIPVEDLASVKAIRTGAAPLDPAIVTEFWSRYRIPVLQNYGATEFAGAVAGWTLADFMKYHDEKPGSVGRFQPGVTGRVVDAASGRELALGEEGVLEMTSEQFGNGGDWLRTTDRAVLDADGFLFIRGRADRAIIRGGFKVHPDDVAKVLELHSAVREAVVVGIDDHRLGAVPVAAVIVSSGAVPPTEDELREFAKARLLPYQVPTRFLFLPELPRTQSMKPALPEIRALFTSGSSSKVSA